MAEKTTKKMTVFEKQQLDAIKTVVGYKLGSEASIVAMIYKNPDLLRETNLTVNDFHTNEWRVYFEIVKDLVINEKKVSVSEIDVVLYLDKHKNLSDKYIEYGGYKTIEDSGAYVDEKNFDGYLQDLRKWNTVIKLVKAGFPCDNERLSMICDMQIEDLYDLYTVHLNDIFSNVENNVKVCNGFEGMRELIDELDEGANVGIPFANCNILNKETGGMLGGNIIGIGAASGCVDCDTEFFTGVGWKRIADYQYGDMVLQYNEDGTAELVEPLAYIKQPAEYLWHFKTPRGLDQCLSDDHICCYIDNNGNLCDDYFENIRKKQEQNGFTGKFILSFDYTGSGIDLSDEEIRLMVAVFADGSFHKKYHNKPTSKLHKQVRFHLKKERKKRRLIELAKSAGAWYERRDSAIDGYNDFYVEAPFRAKHYPKEWYNCNKHQLKIIAEEVMFWDGSYKTKNEYCTTCKEDADFIQFVYSALGYRAYISVVDRVGGIETTGNEKYVRKSIEYKVLVSTQNLACMNVDKRNPEAYTKISKYKTIDGYEYCFKVPSQMMVLRRNNRVFVTHNCGKSTLSINYILPSMVKYNLKALFIINEEDERKFKKEALCWYASNVLGQPIPKHVLRDGNFDKQTKEALYKAAEWFESQKNNHNITIIPLERYTSKTVVKTIKKYTKMGCDVIVLDTLKESADARNKESWKSMMTDCVDFYDAIKHTDTCMIITYQLVKNKSKYLTSADIGVSKGILDVFSVNLFFRRPLQTEYAGEKDELFCYKIEGKTKIPFKLDKDKHYMICFVNKNRFGTSDIQIVSEADFSINKYEDKGYCTVVMDY